MKIGVIGSGAVGTPLVRIFSAGGHEVAGLFASVPEGTVVIDTTNYVPFAPKGWDIPIELVDESGFDPFDAGELADSWCQQPGTPAYCTELDLGRLGPALQAADREKTPAIRDQSLDLGP